MTYFCFFSTNWVFSRRMKNRNTKSSIRVNLKNEKERYKCHNNNNNNNKGAKGREGKGGGETLVEEDKCQLLTIRMIKRIVKSKGRRVKRIIIRKSHCSLNYLLFLIVFVCIICCFTLK